MTGSPGSHDAVQLQQHIQQHVLTAAAAAVDLHHHHQYLPPHPPQPPSTSSSPWQALTDLTELPPQPPDDMDDEPPLPLPPPPSHPGVTPFQQLVGSFGPGCESFGPTGGSVSTGGPAETDDDTVVSLDEPLHHAVAAGGMGDPLDVVHKPHQTTRPSAAPHVLFAQQQRLNAPA